MDSIFIDDIRTHRTYKTHTKKIDKQIKAVCEGGDSRKLIAEILNREDWLVSKVADYLASELSHVIEKGQLPQLTYHLWQTTDRELLDKINTGEVLLSSEADNDYTAKGTKAAINALVELHDNMINELMGWVVEWES